MGQRISRREFGLQSSQWVATALAGATVTAQTACRTVPKPLAPKVVAASPKGKGKAKDKAKGKAATIPPSLKVAFFDAQGKPMDDGRRNSLYAADLHFEPERRQATLQDGGAVEIGVSPQLRRVSLHARIAVPNFGDLWVVADNEGEGYQRPRATLDFVREAARSRLADVERLIRSSRAKFSPECLGHRDGAIESLALAAKTTGEKAARFHMEALSHGLWAGELAVVENARHTIAVNPPRRNFLFGCNAFAYRPDTPYAQYFPQVFNYATLPFYLASLERQEGSPNYSRVDAILPWCEKTGIVPKGHPLWWGHAAGIPPWLDGSDWPTARKHCIRVVGRSVERYRGRIDRWDVINEAHDWANGLNLTHDQEIEITRICCDTAREKNSRATIVVNNCCPFGEYAAQGHVYKGPIYDQVFTPLSYLTQLVSMGVQFDVVGVQIYYPDRDMMAIGKLLNEYARFGKPVHITELGVRTEPERPRAQAAQQALPVTRWHEPWCEKVQADWLEWFYTMSYARKEIRAITWWDFSERAFIPSGAFLRDDQTPREIFFRLKALRRGWGV